MNVYVGHDELMSGIFTIPHQIKTAKMKKNLTLRMTRRTRVRSGRRNIPLLTLSTCCPRRWSRRVKARWTWSRMPPEGTSFKRTVTTTSSVSFVRSGTSAFGTTGQIVTPTNHPPTQCSPWQSNVPRDTQV